MLGPSFLGPDWRAWRAAGAAGVRPSAYITLASLERSGLRLGLMQALPNYFVGLGLVMTFLGLIAGLWFASQGMRTADMIEARAALVHLLNSATFKFLTSVAGIAMSLVVSLAFRISVQSLRLRLDLLCDRIEEATARGARTDDRLPAGTDGGAVLAERITQLVQSIDRLEAADRQTAADAAAMRTPAVRRRSAERGAGMSHPADRFSKDEGYYASMADLMAGMLFIFIIVAMVFAMDVRKDRVDAVAEAEAKAEARVKAELDIPATPLDRPAPVDIEIAVRARLVETIRDFLASRGVQVESEPREGLLRLPAGPLLRARRGDAAAGRPDHDVTPRRKRSAAGFPACPAGRRRRTRLPASLSPERACGRCGSKSMPNPASRRPPRRKA